MIKEFIFYALIGFIVVGVMIFFSGLPGEDVSFYENNTVVCKKWSDTWELGKYPNRQCWKLEEIK